MWKWLLWSVYVAFQPFELNSFYIKFSQAISPETNLRWRFSPAEWVNSDMFLNLPAQRAARKLFSNWFSVFLSPSIPTAISTSFVPSRSPIHHHSWSWKTFFRNFLELRVMEKSFFLSLLSTKNTMWKYFLSWREWWGEGGRIRPTFPP